MPATAYWFCPENDIALASGREVFTPPRQAALLGRYGAPLLWWMGTPNDIVLIPSDLTPEEADSLGQWEMHMKARFGAGPRLLSCLQGENIDSLRPWGWSGYTARCLRRAGAPSHLLDEIRPGLDRLRQLSHRKSSVEITRRLDESLDLASFGIPPSVRHHGNNVYSFRGDAVDCKIPLVVERPRRVQQPGYVGAHVFASVRRYDTPAGKRDD